MNQSYTLKEGSVILAKQVSEEPDPEKQADIILDALRAAQKAAIHEAAIILSLGGRSALDRLFAHYGITGPTK